MTLGLRYKRLDRGAVAAVLTSDGSSITIAGQDALTKRGLKVSAVGGSMALTGQPIVSVAWATAPDPEMVAGSTTPYNLGQDVESYNANTDEFRVTPGYVLPSWLSLTTGPGAGSGNLTPNGSQTTGDTFDDSVGKKIDVRRSGGAWVSSAAFGVTVTATTAVAPSGTRVLLSEWKDGPDWTFANSYLQIRWDNLGGDYLDANLVSQGPTAFASCTAINSGTAGQTRTWSIGTLIDRLRSENTAIYLKATTGGGNFWFASKENGTYAGPSLSVVTNQGTFAPTLLKDYFIVNGIDSENLYNNYNGQLGGLNSDHKILLKFDLSVIPAAATISSATLTMTTAGAGSTAYPLVYGAFLLDPPSIITQPELQLGGVETGIASAVASDAALASHSSVVAYDTFESLAAINNGNWRWVPRNSGSWANGPSYTTFTGSDLPAAQITVEPGVGWGTSGNSFAKPVRQVWPPEWHNTLDGTTDNPLTPPNRPWCRDWTVIETAPLEAYLRYVIEIDEDADVGLAQDSGINMVRMARLENVTDDISNGINPEGRGTVFSYAPGFGGVGFRPRGNPSTHGPIFRAQVYVYDYENGFGAPGTSSDKYLLEPNICFEAGRKYTIEQYVKLNTWNGLGTPYDGDASHWNSDGIQRIWINGVRCQLRSYTTGLISNFEGGRKIRTHEKERIISLPWGDFFAIGPINPAGSAYHLKIGAMAVTTDKTPGGIAYIGPPQKPLPSWASSSVVGTWMDIPGTALSTVPEPSQPGAPAGWQIGNTSARLSAWVTPVLRKASSTVILGPGGGHGDYFMNWMSEVELGLDTPQCRLLSQGSRWDTLWPNSGMSNPTQPAGGYVQAPVATHSYYRFVYCDQRDWFIYLALENRASTIFPFSTLTPATPSDQWYASDSVGISKMVAAFDYTTKVWLGRSTIADVPAITTTIDVVGRPVCVHPVTGDVYFCFNGTMWVRWNQAANNYSVFPTAINGWAGTAIDPIRNRIFVNGTYRRDIPGWAVPPQVVDCATGAVTFITMTGNSGVVDFVNQVTDNHDLDSGDGHPSIEWCDHLEKFIYVRGSSSGRVRVVMIDPVSWECVEYTPTSGVHPAVTSDGVLRKAMYVPNLRGLVYVNSYTQNMRYLRLW